MDVLQKAELRQLDQRISIRCYLKALTREEVEAYVTHRLWVARGSTSVSFTPKAFDLVHLLSGGVPRMINLICDRALMAGCQRQASRITEDHVVTAAANLNIAVPKARVRSEPARKIEQPAERKWMARAGGAVLVLLAVAGLWWLGSSVQLMSAPLETPAPVAPQQWLPPAVAPLAVPAGMPVIGPPPPMPGSFSILVGTFDTARQVEQITRELRDQKLPVYLVDVLQPAGDILRRIFIGRYATREEADRVRGTLNPALAATARVMPGALERRLVIPPLP
jgi:hypothetical protein